MQNMHSRITSEVLESWNTGVTIECEKKNIEEWQREHIYRQ